MTDGLGWDVELEKRIRTGYLTSMCGRIAALGIVIFFSFILLLWPLAGGSCVFLYFLYILNFMDVSAPFVFLYIYDDL